MHRLALVYWHRPFNIVMLGDPVLTQCWLNIGLMLVQCWLSIGLMLVQCWLNIGLMLMQCWLNIGLMLVQCLLNIGLKLVQCWATLDHNWLYTGPQDQPTMVAHCSMGSTFPLHIYNTCSYADDVLDRGYYRPSDNESLEFDQCYASWCTIYTRCNKAVTY